MPATPDTPDTPDHRDARPRSSGRPTLGMRLRSAVYLAWLVLTVVPYALAALALSLVVSGRPLYRFCTGWAWLALQGARYICGIEWRVQGLDNLPQGPAIVLSKHQSAWETLALPILLGRPLSYVFKRELLWVPFFGWTLGRLDMVHIDRSRGAQAFSRMQQQGRELLDKGYSIVMFPEGTRTARGKSGPYKSGGAKLALLTGAPVVPVAVTSARCWPRQAFVKRPGVIDVSIGAPLPPQAPHASELSARVERWIEHEMHRLDADAYASAPAGAPSAGEPAER